MHIAQQQCAAGIRWPLSGQALLGYAMILFLFSSAPKAGAASLPALRGSVFQISVVSQDPNFTDPWKKFPASSSSGTGFFIGDGRILTNAHVVASATFITVQRDGDAKPEPAFVTFIGHDCDLAILTIRDPGHYFKGVKPMIFGSLPKLRSPVATIGFPTGGEQISVTEGIVSRVDFRRYVHHGQARHLLVQVDSAINPGNSGGPVVQGRDVVGVAFQSYTAAENTGYIIPTPVIRRFLKDVEDGVYDGHPDDGLTTSKWTVVNPSTAAYHGLEEADGGIKVAHVATWAITHDKIRVGDILLAIDDQPIGVDGKVDFQKERVDFRTLFDLRQKGDVVRFLVARDGRKINVDVEIKPARAHHVPDNVYARYPKYLVYGGLVFTTLSRSYLRSWGSQWYKQAPLLLRFLDIYARFEPEAELAEDIIVLAGRLPDAVNAYSGGNMHGVVTAVNGKPVESLATMAKRLDQATGEFVEVDFWGSDEPLIMSRAAVAAATVGIDEKYGVMPDRWLQGDEVDGAVSMLDNPPETMTGVKP